MSNKTVINIKADKQVKEQAQRVAEEMGLNLSAVVNATLKQFIRTREVHFIAAPRMTPMLEQIIAQAERDRKAGRNITGPFTVEEAIKYLNS